MPKLQHYFNFILQPPPAKYSYKETGQQIIEEARIPAKNNSGRDSPLLIGIEVELENISSSDIRRAQNTEWLGIKDNSLKDSGYEFTCPVYVKDAKRALIDLFSHLTAPIASKRCSTHIHVNLYDLTEEQIWSIIYLYLVFERVLYRYSGNRWDSNYCVPVQTFLFEKPDFTQLINALPKYSGIHFLPDKKLATLEFRHMKGSTNPDEIDEWIQIINHLISFALSNLSSYVLTLIPEMRTTSYYWQLLEQIFLGYTPRLQTKETKEDIEAGLTYTKLLMLGK